MKKIVVVGGGTMGLDIAHTFARSGHAVVVREISDELAEKSHSRLVAALDKLVARGKMDEAKRAEILGNMTFTTDLAAAADADLVLEAIVENLDVKKSLFQELDGICKADTIFATNTSSISITAIAAATQRLQRIVGMSTAMELVLTSRTIDAQEALQIGLVKHVYPADVMLDKALELADLIASRPQVAVRQAKQAIRIGKQIDINSAIAFESEAFGLCFSTEDQKDAMHAFLNKEKITTFKNR